MAKQEWHKVEDIKAFMAGGRKVSGVHSPKIRRGIPWPCCSRRGLLYLKNEATRRAIKQACVTIED